LNPVFKSFRSFLSPGTSSFSPYLILTPLFSFFFFPFLQEPFPPPKPSSLDGTLLPKRTAILSDTLVLLNSLLLLSTSSGFPWRRGSRSSPVLPRLPFPPLPPPLPRPLPPPSPPDLKLDPPKPSQSQECRPRHHLRRSGDVLPSFSSSSKRRRNPPSRKSSRLPHPQLRKPKRTASLRGRGRVRRVEAVLLGRWGRGESPSWV